MCYKISQLTGYHTVKMWQIPGVACLTRNLPENEDVYLAAKGSMVLSAGGGGLRLFLRRTVRENGSPEVLRIVKQSEM